MEAIVGKTYRDNELHYLVKWVGCSEDQNTYLPIGRLQCEDLIAEYEMTLDD